MISLKMQGDVSKSNRVAVYVEGFDGDVEVFALFFGLLDLALKILRKI
jgi:hypothetical protein